jgi:Dolichyl-phosphate-mannose-protein mannosyltransferase
MMSIVQTETQTEVPASGTGSWAFAFRDRLIPVLVFVVSFAYLSMFCHYTSLEPDEGIVLQGAERILHGEVPYRDFFSFYTPGSFYLVAFLFRFAADSLVAARISLAVAGAICSVVTYLLARRVCSSGIAVFAAALTTSTGFAYRFLVLHNWYSTLLACLALYAAVRSLESHKASWGFVTGCLSSLTILFEQSKGAGLCMGLALGFLSLRILRRQSIFRSGELASMLSGFLLPIIPVWVYLGMKRSLATMLRDWIWPLQHYTQANHVPYGWQNWSDSARQMIFYSGPVGLRILKTIAVSPGFLVPVVPLVGLGLFGYWLAQMRRQEPVPRHCSYYVLVSAVSSGLLLSVVIVRPDIIHLIYLAPLWYVLLAWVLGSSDLRSPALASIRPYLSAFVTASFGIMALALLLGAVSARSRIETRRGTITTTSKDSVIEYVQAHVAPGHEILVYPYLPLYNYLTATRSPSAHDYFQPGMNTKQQADEIILSLKSHPARSILFEPWFASKFSSSWPRTPLVAIANDPVADFIVRNYQVCAILQSPAGWQFEYLVRKTPRVNEQYNPRNEPSQHSCD